MVSNEEDASVVLTEELEEDLCKVWDMAMDEVQTPRSPIHANRHINELTRISKNVDLLHRIFE